MLSTDDLLEGADRILKRNEFAFITGEDLRDLERLRHETLDLTRALDLSTRTTNQPGADEQQKIFNAQ